MMSVAMTEDVRNSAAKDDIINEARGRLEQYSLLRGHSRLIRIDEHDGTLVLHGRLPSYYLKQILQTTLRNIDGVTEIDMRVDVFWPGEE
jgi:hypothetical protein